MSPNARDRLHNYGCGIVFVVLATTTVRVLWSSVVELWERWR
jgi:hypothetical protein